MSDQLTKFELDELIFVQSKIYSTEPACSCIFGFTVPCNCYEWKKMITNKC